MSKVQDEYILDREIIDEKFHIKVYKPVLTEEERARRREHLKRVTANYMKAFYAAKKGKNNGT